MTFTFKIDTPNKFTKEELSDFLKLLIKQGQVNNPNLDNIKASSFICLVYCENLAIGIGAIKQVYKTPFDKAKVSEFKNEYDYELGYLFIDNNQKIRGLGLGKTICKILLKQISEKNVFATTEQSELNPMKFILESLGFKIAGETYVGSKSKKSISLYVKEQVKTVELMFDDLLTQTLKAGISHTDLENGTRYEEFKQIKEWKLRYGYKFNIYSNDHLIDGKKHFHFDNKSQSIMCKFDFDGNLLVSSGKNSVPANVLKELNYFLANSKNKETLNQMWDELNTK